MRSLRRRHSRPLSQQKSCTTRAKLRWAKTIRPHAKSSGEFFSENLVLQLAPPVGLLNPRSFVWYYLSHFESGVARAVVVMPKQRKEFSDGAT